MKDDSLQPLPARNVARFMLPLADVMTVLFSLFLLMPHLGQESGAGQRSAAAPPPGTYWSPEEQQAVREELDRLRRLGRVPPYERLYLVVFQVDHQVAHRLICLNEPQRTEVNSKEELQKLLSRYQAEAERTGRHLFCVVQLEPLPAGVTRQFPRAGGADDYATWFGGVPHSLTWRTGAP